MAVGTLIWHFIKNDKALVFVCTVFQIPTILFSSPDSFLPFSYENTIMKAYKLTVGTQIRHLWGLLLLMAVMPLVIHYLMIIKLGGYTFETALKVGIIFFVIFIAPTILIHINHYAHSKTVQFSVDTEAGSFLYGKSGLTLKFSSEDIETITCYKSYPLARNKTPFLVWDLYNYAEIALKSGQKVRLSSLIINEFDKAISFDFDRLQVKATVFAWM